MVEPVRLGRVSLLSLFSGVCVWPVPGWSSVSHSEIMSVVPTVMGDGLPPRHQPHCGARHGGSWKHPESSSFPCWISPKYRKIMRVFVCVYVQVVIHALFVTQIPSVLLETASFIGPEFTG